MSSEPEEARPDFEAEGLLEGVEGPAREARLRLLNRLFDGGVGLDELREAAAHDRLVILPAEQALGSDARFSERQLSERAGVPLDFFLAVRRAQGLAVSDPDERVYSENDLDAARLMADFYDAGFDREGMLEAARVLGRGMRQFADALGELFGQTFIKAGVTEDELGLRNAEAARELLPRVTPLIEYALRQHMRERLRHQAVSQAMLEAGELPGAREVAVAFADMVAFTRLGEELAPEDVGGIASRLGELASECARPPVRLVKMIGDAAMIVAPDPEALLGSALELVAQADEIEAFPRLRAGAAYGPALGRSGDWYGRPINVASRVTDIAEPGTVVGTQELCEAAGESCPWTSVGRHTLKGIEGDVELFRAERNAAGKPPS
jgi:adenylate cyclase